MKKKLLIVFVLLIGGLLAACSSEPEEEELPFLEVNLEVHPEKGEPNEPVVFEAHVTFGGEPVTEPDEVVFEIWRAHDEEHEKLEIEHSENGIYRLEKTFEREGTYYIISHVTAEYMHNMPKREFVIGEPSEPEENGNSSHMDHMEEHEEESEHQE